jgi:hypothetical protein
MGEDIRIAQPKMQVRIARDLYIRDRFSSDGYRAGCGRLERERDEFITRPVEGKPLSYSFGSSCRAAQRVFL